MGFRELQRRCELMSSSVLSTRLGELTGARVLTLHDDAYHLTRLGEDLMGALGPLTAWSRRWAEEMRTETAGDEQAGDAES
ncbi:transcriptional regulator, HxlR family [Actinacidiphila alni]|uniref:Transcriptional regulator, HxlR family n=1 Tax=Actinacidiphila alni TaxID=380248 RepID=A0A1I2AMM0_9ACTN|nr:transcriptional regulator, HxlR family [Actinacidiphila alni]